MIAASTIDSTQMVFWPVTSSSEKQLKKKKKNLKDKWKILFYIILIRFLINKLEKGTKKQNLICLVMRWFVSC